MKTKEIILIGLVFLIIIIFFMFIILIIENYSGIDMSNFTAVNETNYPSSNLIKIQEGVSFNLATGEIILRNNNKIIVIGETK